MTIGMEFPVKDSAMTIPWGIVEPHRAEIQKAHGRTLEYLAAHGGLAGNELAKIIGDAAVPRSAPFGTPCPDADPTTSEIGKAAVPRSAPVQGPRSVPRQED